MASASLVAPFASVVTPVSSSVATLPLQLAEVAVIGTYLLFALFLSFTAFLAARNVLGDVPWRRYLVVGPPVAAIGFLGATFGRQGIFPFLALAVALLVDAALIARLHDVPTRLVVGITVIHFVVSVLLGAVLFGVVALVGTMPG